jgi:hypothetical protein
MQLLDPRQAASAFGNHRPSNIRLGFRKISATAMAASPSATVMI